MLTRPIGSKFELGGVDLIVIKHYGCEGCFFENCRCNFPALGACSPDFRDDNRSVIFKKVEATKRNT